MRGRTASRRRRHEPSGSQRLRPDGAGVPPVVGGVLAVLAGPGPVAFGLHPVQRSVLAPVGGGVAPPHGPAQRQDQVGPVACGGVAIHAGQEPVDGSLMPGQQLIRRRGIAPRRRVAEVGSGIARLGGPVASLCGDIPAQGPNEQLVVEVLCGAVAVPLIGRRVAAIGREVAPVGDSVTHVSGRVADISEPVAVRHHTHPALRQSGSNSTDSADAEPAR